MNARGQFLVYMGFIEFLEKDYVSCKSLCDKIIDSLIISEDN